MVNRGVVRATDHLEDHRAKLQKEQGYSGGSKTKAQGRVGARTVDQDQANYRDSEMSLVVDVWLALWQGVFPLDREDVSQPFAYLPFPNLEKKRDRHKI